MKNKILFFLVAICLTIQFQSCTDPDEIPNDSILDPSFRNAVEPIYASENDWQNIDYLSPQPIEKLGKIYYKDNFIYVNELNKGIHIINNSNPTNPIFVSFIQVPGSKDIAIKGNYLYTDNVSDLLVFDISDFNNVSVVNRVPNVYPSVNQSFPEFHNGPFVCVDPARGTVIGWQETDVTEMDCRR
ncbi:MAG: hypothetical protein ACPG5P_01085 [Saprospiraceae bacterium]